MDALEHMAAFGPAPAWLDGLDLDRTGSREGLALAAAIWTGAQRHAAESVAAIARAKLDQRLSLTGQAEAAKTAAELALKRVTTWREALGSVSRSRDQAVAALEKDQAAPNPVLLAAVWQQLPRDDAYALEVMHADAMDVDDHLTAVAVESLPVAFGQARLPADTVSKLRNSRLKAANPEAAGKIMALETAISDTITVLDIAESDIRQAAGMGPRDPLADGLHALYAEGEDATE